ncbi:carbohydrate ABC transporter permease [Mycolicibacterium mengxianglii]|uniref:carbohydrate ABC transporter permease n=1 Tax=Mycolicibacterium mengxianglii TaxID=2736649 RepID=UPI0018EF15DD|nr:sugar ABC transporter permease [Mycolicibacterium mengxianglii]
MATLTTAEAEISLPAGPQRGRRRRGYTRRRRRAGWLYLSPALIVLAALLGFPIIQSFLMSFRSVRAAQGLFGGTWAGLANYQKLFDDPAVVKATANTVYFTVAEVVVVVAISLLFAQLLNHPRVKSSFFTVVLLIPWAIAPVANATIWKWIYNGNYGILNQALLALGVIDKPIVWLADPTTALNMMLFADIWKSIPFITLLLLAGLRGIPPVLYKAAKIDGASHLQTIWSITLPQIRPVLLICVVLQSIWAVKVFDLIYVLTKGGPADGTVTLNFLAYRSAFNFGDLGYGSALANLLFIIMFVAALIYVRLLGAQRRKPSVADAETAE